MPNPSDTIELTQADNDALADMYRAYKRRGLEEQPGGVGAKGGVEILIAHLVGVAGCGFGYYQANFYARDPLLFDVTTNLTFAKLGTGYRSLVGTASSGYVYSLDDLTVPGAPSRLLDTGFICPCHIVGNATDGKPVGELLGNPIQATFCLNL